MNGFKYIVIALLSCSLLVAAGCTDPKERGRKYRENAEKLYAEGDLVKAEIEVKNALQILPKNPPSRFLLAQINEQRGDYQEMAANLRVAIDANPEYSEARIKLGTLYVLAGSLELAEEQANALSETARETAEGKIFLARIAAAQGDLESAEGLLEQALELDSSNIQALGLLASISATTDLDRALELIERGIAEAEDPKPLRLLRVQLLQQDGARPAEVEAEYRQLMTDFPEEEIFGYQLARFLASEGKIDDVPPVLEQMIRNNPENIEIRLALVQFVANSEGPESAEALLEKYAKELPEAFEIQLALARLYQQTGRPDDAYAQYAQVAELAGNEDAGLIATARMAGIKLAAGETELGEELLESVLSVDSANSEALLLRGALKIDKEKFRGAVSDLRTLLRSDPDNVRAQLLLARAHSTAGDIVLAEDAYRRALVLDPGNVTATLELARIKVARNRPEAAEDILRKQVERNPSDVRSARALIGLLVSQSEFADAEEEARRVIALPDQEPVGYFLLGGVYQAQDEHEKAIDAFTRSLEFAPTAREPLRGLVASMVRLGRTNEAVAYLEQLQQEYPDNLYARTLLGQVLAGSGEAGEAEAVFEAALADNESWLPAYTALAGLQSGDISAQIDTYKRGLEALPGSQELALLLGTAYERNGQIDAAIASYEEALAINPDQPAVANNLAALLADNRTDSKSLDRALELAEQFKNSDNPAFLDTLGWVYYRQEKYERALPLLEESVEKAGQVPVLRYHLGMAYLALERPEDAREQLEIAVADESARFTGYEEAKEALAGL